MAPEVINKNYKGLGCDYWSLGISIFIMLTGVAPFKGNTFDEIEYNICHEEPLINLLNCSNSLKSLIKNLLQKDPSKRHQHQQILDSEWYKEMQKEYPHLDYITVKKNMN